MNGSQDPCGHGSTDPLPRPSRLQDNRQRGLEHSGTVPQGDSLPAAPPARTESGSLLVYVPPPAPIALTDLLQSFRSALQVADKLPPVLTVRAGDGKFTRQIQVPRLRMFLRYFLNQHICRRLAHLKRAFHADAAVGIDRMGELSAIDHFEQARAGGARSAASSSGSRSRCLQRDRDRQRRQGARAGAAEPRPPPRCAARSRASSPSTPTG